MRDIRLLWQASYNQKRYGKTVPFSFEQNKIKNASYQPGYLRYQKLLNRQVTAQRTRQTLESQTQTNFS